MFGFVIIFRVVTAKSDIKGLRVNAALNNAERVLEGKIPGAKFLLPRGDSIYATLVDGNIVRIDGENVTFIASFGKPCELPVEEHICGRPLGMAFDTQGNNLIVADAYFGLWEVNLDTSEKKQLVSPNQVIGVKVS